MYKLAQCNINFIKKQKSNTDEADHAVRAATGKIRQQLRHTRQSQVHQAPHHATAHRLSQPQEVRQKNSACCQACACARVAVQRLTFF